jgi:zinc D-Ala-D-Ala carboxypeptidase
VRVEGITGIATRMAEIRHQLATFRPQAVPVAQDAAAFAGHWKFAGS